jgi:prolyl 4-hydroxylase
MHHDSSRFLPRFLTAFYYLNEVEGGGETAFPAADGAMSPADALALAEPGTADGAGLVVRPERGAALLWYNHDADGAIDPFAVHAGCRVTAGEKWGANQYASSRAASNPRAATRC